MKRERKQQRKTTTPAAAAAAAAESTYLYNGRCVMRPKSVRLLVRKFFFIIIVCPAFLIYLFFPFSFLFLPGFHMCVTMILTCRLRLKLSVCLRVTRCNWNFITLMLICVSLAKVHLMERFYFSSPISLSLSFAPLNLALTLCVILCEPKFIIIF